MNAREPEKGNGMSSVSRRQFVGGAAAVAAFTIVPGHVLGANGATPPSEKITMASIGIGDQGKRDLETFLGKSAIRVIAVCDVDSRNRDTARDVVNKKYGAANCAAFTDFRELLASQKGLDAALIVVPDHSHATVTMAAMKAGKHVYCQKPFTHTVYEARALSEMTRRSKLATQLGTVNQAGEGPRLLREWIEDGAIGGVKEVHVWTNRPFWPQGMQRPADTPPVPSTLNWDLWLGPAPYRPYHPAYLPLVFRGWWDFGTGALGDMGCYGLDTIFRVLSLKSPIGVESCGSGFAAKMWDRPKMNRGSYPHASMITWDFPARGTMPPVRVTWYDGGLRPPRPRELEDNRPMRDEGVYYMGERGTIVSDFTGDSPRIVPESKMKAYQLPAKRLPRSIGHHEEWIRACQGGEPAGANFEFSAVVTEAMLLGNVALRAEGRRLLWDAPSMKVTNVEEANQWLHYKYREGWTL